MKKMKRKTQTNKNHKKKKSFSTIKMKKCTTISHKTHLQKANPLEPLSVTELKFLTKKSTKSSLSIFVLFIHEPNGKLFCVCLTSQMCQTNY
uniref:Uncharacterized protein n=1 Tax=Nelumbo nucifera TaxID=4432 RepID=A0A822XV60_NELNU|nr:TPA_asm: hypothetical protein HUJ06_024524 [Nelumbo nucifera]